MNLFLKCENGHHTHRHVLCFCPLSLFFSLSPFPPPWTDGWPKDRFYCLLFSVFVRVFYGSYFFGLNIPLTKYFGDDGRGVCWLLVKHTYPQSGKKGTPTNNSTTATPAPTTNSTHTCSYTFSHIYIHTRNAPHHHIRHATHTRTHTHIPLRPHGWSHFALPWFNASPFTTLLSPFSLRPSILFILLCAPHPIDPHTIISPLCCYHKWSERYDHNESTKKKIEKKKKRSSQWRADFFSPNDAGWWRA